MRARGTISEGEILHKFGEIDCNKRLGAFTAMIQYKSLSRYCIIAVKAHHLLMQKLFNFNHSFYSSRTVIGTIGFVSRLLTRCVIQTGVSSFEYSACSREQ